MKQLRHFGLTLIAVLALGALASATASADSSGILFLEKEEGPFAFSVKGGASTIATKAGVLSIACTETTGEGESVKEEEGKKTHYRLGTGTVTIKGCKEKKGESKGACNTVGAAAETVVVPYDWHIFDALEGTTLKAGFSFLILNPPLIVKCFAGTARVEVKGAALGFLNCLSGQECLNGKVDVKDVTAKFVAAGVTCDTSGTECSKIKKEEPFLIDFTGTFEAVEETTEMTFASVTKGESKEKMFFIDD